MATEGSAALEDTRLGLCDEFAVITGSDDAVGQCYLAENDWDMERALNAFFEAHMDSEFDDEDSLRVKDDKDLKRKLEEPGKMDNAETNNKKLKTSETVCIDLTEEEPACSSSSKAEAQEDQDQDKKLSLISWNVDGLDTLSLTERARGLCSYLALYNPDVVFLQELIPCYVQYLKKRAVSYTVIEGNEEGYFTGLMLKKSRVTLIKSEIVAYPMTQMMRNLLVAQVNFAGQQIYLMTSHLESCKNQSVERMNQLRMVLKKISEVPDNAAVIFGGDTNLRDEEVARVGGLPAGVCDIWESLGKPEHCRYTWDTRANSNKSVSYVSRCRFDRIFLRPAKVGPKMLPEHMTLVGQEKLDCGRYTSDHWGIYCGFTTQTS
ncbi:tyrosyl-DNA phosphodiesterase 2 [Denticeps clupeoides]|uniref:Tyrosyl-DNA phosphodiesterase 2 n=1 Tax=Denticeps clupeoides TaxID=299321 RepID=A0AAY4CDA5_9TELE|nr:tyrosyl-DNA phosphodiesterase 2 [Denticeps clupeoides]